MSATRSDLGCVAGDTVDELAGLYFDLDEAAQAVAQIARRGGGIELVKHRVSGMYEVKAHERPGSVEELAGLYATFEAAADAVARLARSGLETEVDVSHPTGRTSGPTIEVRIAGTHDDRAPGGVPT